MAHREVIDRVVVPIEWWSTGGSCQGLWICNIESGGADCTTGPEQVDLGVENFTEGCEVWLIAIAPVFGRAHDQIRGGIAAGTEGCEYRVCQFALRLGDAAELAKVCVVLESRGNILRARVANTQPRRDAVDQFHSVLSARAREGRYP